MDDVDLVFDEIVKETELAIKFKFDKKEVWLPKSEIRVYPKTKKIYLPEWLANKNGLI